MCKMDLVGSLIFAISYEHVFVSPAKHGQHIGIMSPLPSGSSVLSHSWFTIDNY